MLALILTFFSLNAHAILKGESSLQINNRVDLQNPQTNNGTELQNNVSGMFADHSSHLTAAALQTSNQIVCQQRDAQIALQNALAASSTDTPQYREMLSRVPATANNADNLIHQARLNAQRQRFTDLSQIPSTREADLPYTFKSPQGAFRDELVAKYQDLYKAPHGGFKRDTARQFGLTALELSDEAYLNQNEEDAQFYKQLGTEFLDLTLGLDPVTGLGRSAFELLTGRNVVTGATLSGLERSFAAVGVMTFGMGSTVVKGAKMATRMFHVFDRATHIISQRTARHTIELAVNEGQAIYTKVEHLVTTTIKNNKIVSIETAEHINQIHFGQWPNTPPFQAGSHVIHGRITQEIVVFKRLHGETNQVRSWVLKESQIRGLSNTEIRSKFAIPEGVQTWISEVHVPRGAEFFRGNIQSHGNGPSGAVQWYLKEPKAEWFKNPKVIE